MRSVRGRLASWLAAWVVCAAGWVVDGARAHAQGGELKESRTLALHRYIPPLLQQTAFVTTHLGVRQGYTSLAVPGVSLDFGKDELRASGYTQTFDLGIKLADFLGVYATLTGTVTSGINAASAFELGADLEGAFEAGGVVRVLRLERFGTQIALRGWGGMAFESDYNVAEFVESGRQATLDTVVSLRRSQALALLITPASTVHFGGSLHIAQTIVQSIGLQTSLAVRRTNKTSEPFELEQKKRLEETVEDTMVDAAFALSFDGIKYRIPLALMPEYRVVHESVRRVDDERVETRLRYNSHYAGGGLYYSGRPNLVLGLGAVVALNLEKDRLSWKASDGSPRSSGTPSERQAHFVLRYVW